MKEKGARHQGNGWRLMKEKKLVEEEAYTWLSVRKGSLKTVRYRRKEWMIEKNVDRMTLSVEGMEGNDSGLK